jgi:hypothetical protein
MTFTSAIRKLHADGGFICRPTPSSCYMELTHGRWLVYMNSEEGDSFPQLFAEDYLANDWQWIKG